MGALNAANTVYKIKEQAPILKTIHGTVTTDGTGDVSILAEAGIVLAAFTTSGTDVTSFKVGTTVVGATGGESTGLPAEGGSFNIDVDGTPTDVTVLAFPQPVSSTSQLYLTIDGASGGTFDYTVVYLPQVVHTAGVRDNQLSSPVT